MITFYIVLMYFVKLFDTFRTKIEIKLKNINNDT